MALSFKKDLEKYKEIDEDEILNKLSEEELKQLESALEEMDPEVTTRRTLSYVSIYIHVVEAESGMSGLGACL